MLKKLIIKNVNSIRVCEIDFVKGNYKFGEENVLNDVVNPIAIYGHNGSGKTSALNAVGHLISLMYYPVESLMPFVVNNFLFEEYNNQREKDEQKIKGSVHLFFDIDNSKYEYFLETTRKGQGSISVEYLTKDDHTLFERQGVSYKYKEEKRTIEGSSPMVPLLRILASSEINDAIIQVVFAYISSFTLVSMPFINRGAFVTSKLFNNKNINDLLVDRSHEVHEILKEYDCFPVYSITKSNKVAPNGLIAPQYNVTLEDGEFKKALPLQMISTGMSNQSLLLSILLSVPDNSVVFIDEVDRALHSRTIKSFFNVIRRKRIQIVCTLHNTFALQVLRPDQVYLAKWKKGFSNFYRLSKVYPNIRQINNIEKMYLSSIFDEAIDENE